MIRTIIIDDEPLAIGLLSEYVKKCPDTVLVSSFENPIEALHFIGNEKIDLILLDIQMPELSGIQFLKILAGKCAVILTTAYEKYALDGYEHDVIDYLLKPITFDRYLIAVEKFKERNSQIKEISDDSTQDYIFIKSSHKLIKVDYDDILFIEGLSDYVVIQTKKEKILSLENMKDLAIRFPSNLFSRVHRSFIVPHNKIEFIEKNRIVIGDKYIPVGNTYKDAFFDKIQ